MASRGGGGGNVGKFEHPPGFGGDDGVENGVGSV